MLLLFEECQRWHDYIFYILSLFFNSTNICLYFVSALSNVSVNKPEHCLYTSGEKGYKQDK